MSLSQPLIRLITEQFFSIEQVEVVLLVRTEPQRIWTVAEVTDRLRRSASSVAARLRDLERRGFVARADGGFRYAPSAERDALLQELATAYAERRLTVINLIFTKDR